jgi:hypothetical protein
MYCRQLLRLRPSMSVWTLGPALLRLIGCALPSSVSLHQP